MSANSAPGFNAAVERAKQIAERIQREALAGQKRGLDEDDDRGIKRPAPDLMAKISEFRHQSDGRGHGGPAVSGANTQPLGMPGMNPNMGDGRMGLDEKTLDMMVPGNKVGLIIGKGGETIRSLQDRAGVKMTIYQNVPDATETEKKLSITGPPDRVENCRQMVLEMLAEKDMERGRRQMGGFNEYGSQMGGGGGGGDRGGDRRGFGSGPSVEVAVPPNFIGLVIGKGGESIKRIQQESGTKIQFDTSKTDSNGNKICSISGPPECVARAQDMIQDIIDNAAAHRSGKFMGGEEIRMPVPSNRCGAVIGRGGETIRVIKQQSGCDIELDKMSKAMGGDEKIFIIRGPPDRIPLAKQLINEKVRGGNASPPPEHSSGGFGSQSGDYSWSNYYQAEHGISPAVAAAAANVAASQQQSDPQWAYYSQYYANMTGQPGGQEQQSSHANGQTSAQGPASGDGQADYTQQWIEYYRNMGMHKEAEQIEAMAKAQKGGAAGGSHPDSSNGSDVKPVAYPGYGSYSGYGPK